MAVLAVLIGIVTLIPIGYITFAVGQSGWGQVRRLVFRPRVGELLGNTGSLTLLAMLSAAIIGTAGAWLLERTDLAGRRIWRPILIAPLAVPAFVTSYGWASAFPGFDGLGAATVIMALSYSPLVLLPVAAALRTSDPALEEQARALGRGALRTFISVTLPQVRPALLGGSLLVGLHTLAEFGAFQNLRFSTFTTAIYEQYQSSFASVAATMLAAVLVLCSLVLILGEQWAGRGRIARVGGGVPRDQRRTALRRPVGLLLPLIPLTITMAALVVPMASVVRWLAIGGRSVWNARVGSAAASTLGLALTAAIVITVLAFPASYLSARRRGWVATIPERVGYLSGSVPSIVVGLALVSVTVHYAKPVYQTYITLLAAYLVLQLPRALVGVRSGLAQVPAELEEAAAALGRGRLITWGRVTLPLAAPGIAAAAALVFLAVASELTATLMLGPTGVSTLATRFWSLSGSIDYPAAAPYAALLVVMALPATALLVRQARQASPR